MQLPLAPADHAVTKNQEDAAVQVIGVDGLQPVATRCHVVRTSRHLDAMWSGDRANVGADRRLARAGVVFGTRSAHKCETCPASDAGRGAKRPGSSTFSTVSLD